MAASKSLQVKYTAFIGKYWPLPSGPRLTEQEMYDIKRPVWYCNNSGMYVPELQKYNATEYVGKYNDTTDTTCRCKTAYFRVDEQERAEEEADESCLSIRFYRNGHTNYHVFKNGLCFLDIHLLSAAYDYINSNFHPKPKEEEVMKHIHAICQGKGVEHITDMMSLVTDMSTGTIIVKPYVPHHILKHLALTAKYGDMVNTEGYRGTGYHVFNGTDFCSVEREEYYPLWAYSYLNERGCRYYTNDYFDALMFGKVYYSSYGAFGPPIAAADIILDSNKNVIHYNGKDIKSCGENEEGHVYETPFPWESRAEPDTLLNLTAMNPDITIKVKVTKHDHMIFSEGMIRMEDEEGEYSPDAMDTDRDIDDIERRTTQLLHKTVGPGNLCSIVAKWKIRGRSNVKAFDEHQKSEVKLPSTWIIDEDSGGTYGADINESSVRYKGLVKDKEQCMDILKTYYDGFRVEIEHETKPKTQVKVRPVKPHQ